LYVALNCTATTTTITPNITTTHSITMILLSSMSSLARRFAPWNATERTTGHDTHELQLAVDGNR